MKSFHLSWQLALALVIAVAAWCPATVQIGRSVHVHNLEARIQSQKQALHRELQQGDFSKADERQKEIKELSQDLYSARRRASSPGF